MNKVLSFSFLVLVTPLFPAFFFFIGIKVEFIDFYQIEEYFNIIFVDKMPWSLYWIFGVIFATLFMLPFKKLAGAIFIAVCLLSMSMLNGNVARNMATKMFVKKPFYIKKKPWTYKGVLLYEGRVNYYLLNEENNRTMTFNKGKIDEAY